mgnify:CR=1 FL=1
MGKKQAALMMTVVLLLAGCSGGNGGATGTPAGTETVTQTPESTGELATPQTAIAGEHPAVTNGTLEISNLVQEHLNFLRGVESFTVLNNRTFSYVENGSVSGRSVLINKGDITNQRQRLEIRAFTRDGDIERELIRYSNATTTCMLRDSESQCSSGGVSTREIIGSTMETTSLETVGAPAFRPDGITNREGQSLYRYSASEFRASLDSNTESELYGANPTLVEATLLVHPTGRIVEYSLTYQTGSETPQELELTYVTEAINATTFEPVNPE